MIKNVNQVFPEYKGQYNGWWSDENFAKCNPASGKPIENNKPKEGHWVCLGDLGILKGEEKKNSKTKEIVMYGKVLWLEALWQVMEILRKKLKLVKCMD